MALHCSPRAAWRMRPPLGGKRPDLSPERIEAWRNLALAVAQTAGSHAALDVYRQALCSSSAGPRSALQLRQPLLSLRRLGRCSGGASGTAGGASPIRCRLDQCRHDAQGRRSLRAGRGLLSPSHCTGRSGELGARAFQPRQCSAAAGALGGRICRIRMASAAAERIVATVAGAGLDRRPSGRQPGAGLERSGHGRCHSVSSPDSDGLPIWDIACSCWCRSR